MEVSRQTNFHHLFEAKRKSARLTTNGQVREEIERERQRQRLAQELGEGLRSRREDDAGAHKLR